MCKHCDKMAPRCPWTHPKSFPDHCDTIRRTSYQNRVTWGAKNDDIWLQEAISCGGCQEDKEPERQDAGRRPVTTKPGMTAVHPTIRAQPVHWCALTTYLTAICACPSFPADLKQEPKVPRASSISWFDRSPGPANSTEQLFFTLLVLNSSTQVKDLNVWADEVLKHEKAYVQEGSAWKIPAEWKPKGSSASPVVKLLPMRTHPLWKPHARPHRHGHAGLVRRRQSAAGEAAAEASLLMVESTRRLRRPGQPRLACAARLSPSRAW